MKYILVLDFDRTITDYDDKLTKTRADKIAKTIYKLLKNHPMKLVLLSLANKAHIMFTVKESNSKLLEAMLDNTLLITEENRTIFQKLNPFRQEKQMDKKNTILQVMKQPKFVEDEDAIRAYKKTNSLKRLSKFNKIPPQNFFFLDDNLYNIKFAKHYGFTSYRVANEIPKRDIISFLDKINHDLSSSSKK
jgi:hypothetical protein